MADADEGELLLSYLTAMVSGRVPATRTFTCPACGGEAEISASPHRNNRLAVRVSCCADVRIDGVDKWAGWERVAVGPTEWP